MFPLQRGKRNPSQRPTHPTLPSIASLIKEKTLGHWRHIQPASLRRKKTESLLRSPLVSKQVPPPVEGAWRRGQRLRHARPLRRHDKTKNTKTEKKVDLFPSTLEAKKILSFSFPFDLHRSFRGGGFSCFFSAFFFATRLLHQGRWVRSSAERKSPEHHMYDTASSRWGNSLNRGYNSTIEHRHDPALVDGFDAKCVSIEYGADCLDSLS